MGIKAGFWPMGSSPDKCPFVQDDVLFESSTPGTYSVSYPCDVFCEVTVIAAGAGGAFNSSSNRSSAAPGSSGSGCIVKIWLKAGITYNIKVGKGGDKQGWLDANCWGGNGENSALSTADKTLINAPGGNGGHVWWPNAAAAAAQPEACTFAANDNIFKLLSIVMNERGRSGGTSTGPGGSSVLSGTNHGKGGSATQAGGGSNATNGNPGYVKIVYKK